MRTFHLPRGYRFCVCARKGRRRGARRGTRGAARDVASRVRGDLLEEARRVGDGLVRAAPAGGHDVEPRVPEREDGARVEASADEHPPRSCPVVLRFPLGLDPVELLEVLREGIAGRVQRAARHGVRRHRPLREGLLVPLPRPAVQGRTCQRHLGLACGVGFVSRTRYGGGGAPDDALPARVSHLFRSNRRESRILSDHAELRTASHLQLPLRLRV